jgi:hypothetical protein
LVNHLGRTISRRGFLGSSAGMLAATAASGPAVRPPLALARARPPAADFATPAAAAAPATATNVQVSADQTMAHIEPAIAADPRDPRIMLAACRVFQNDAIGLASYTTRDAGAHWVTGGLLTGLVPEFDGNPAVAFDRTGTGYICGIAATAGQPRRGDALLWRTHDGGRTLLPSVTAISGNGGLADHCCIAADPHGPGPTPLLYATAILTGAGRNSLAFTRSGTAQIFGSRIQP